MTNPFLKFFYTAPDSSLNLAVCLLIFAAFVLGCGGISRTSKNEVKKEIPPAFLGSWTGQDGSTLSIRNDATGDYKAGSTSVEGAAVVVDEDAQELKMTLLGFEVKKFKLDQPPSGNTMQLDGMIYKRSGGFVPDAPTSRNTTKTSDANKSVPNDSRTATTRTSTDDEAETPTEIEIQSLVKSTLLDFNSGVQSGSFDSFHSSGSSYFQDQLSPEKLERNFAAFIDRKIDISEISGEEPVFSRTPSVETQKGVKILNASGYYPTKPRTNFDLQYVFEDSEWKLLSFEVKVK